MIPPSNPAIELHVAAQHEASAWRIARAEFEDLASQLRLRLAEDIEEVVSSVEELSRLVETLNRKIDTLTKKRTRSLKVMKKRKRSRR